MAEKQVKTRQNVGLVGECAVWQDIDAKTASILFNQIQLEREAANCKCESEYQSFLRWQQTRRDYILGQGEYDVPVKEEAYKGKFLEEIFEHCLNYELHKNLFPESTNETDAGSADAAYRNEKGSWPLVIEIKDIKTKIDETEKKDKNGNRKEALVDQAFRYKNGRNGCMYVVTCNFANLRFYIDNKTRWIQFNLLYDGWTYADFQKFYFCCSKKSIDLNKPKFTSEQSSIAEKNITNELYEEYREFRAELIADIIDHNSAVSHSYALEAAQKLLDRFFFIFYAEDRGLIPVMTVQNHIIHKFEEVKKNAIFSGISVSLYQICKTYFEFINSGYDVPPDIYQAFNGGLFAKDETLDSLVISDDVLLKHISEITQYDFSEHGIGLQVLGHIFEQTLKDIDEMQEKAKENALSRNWLLETHIRQNAEKGKKKDSTKANNGVVYTPEYITIHIIEKSLGRLCADRWKSLEIDNYLTHYKRIMQITDAWLEARLADNELTELRSYMKQYDIQLVEKAGGEIIKVVLDADHLPKSTSKSNIQKLAQEFAAFGRHKVLQYRKFLEELKICDPAVGSGAFLISVLGYLKNEYKKVVEYMRYFGESLPLSDIDAFILQNNLYGVDVLEGAVSICRLSLWLNTARQHHKLNKLSERIKCGDSLLSFEWKKAFPEVFERENPGFDVVIANPPYVQLQSIKSYSDKIKNAGYETYDAKGDLYCLFTERIYRDLLRQGGYAAMIMQNHWMTVDYGAPLRRFLSKARVLEILNFGDVQFFEGVTTYPCIFALQKTDSVGDTFMYTTHRKIYNAAKIGNAADALKYELEHNGFVRSQSELSEEMWVLYRSRTEKLVWEKLKQYPTLSALIDVDNNIRRGVLTGCNDAFYIDEAKRRQLIIEDPKSAEIIAKRIVGEDVKAWYTSVDGQYMISTFPSKKVDIDNYPAIKSWLQNGEWGSKENLPIGAGELRLAQIGKTQEYDGVKFKSRKANGDNKWYEIQDSIAYYKLFSQPKIIYPNMTRQFPFMYSEEEVYTNDKTFIITCELSSGERGAGFALNDSKRLLFILVAILNTSLAKRWIWLNCPEIQGGTREIRKTYFQNFPMPQSLCKDFGELDAHAQSEIEQLAELSKNRYETTKAAVDCASAFRTLMRDNLDFDLIYSGKSEDARKKREGRELPAKLVDFEKLKDFSEFVKVAKIAFKDQSNWKEPFEEAYMTVKQHLARAEMIDREIELKVFSLYDLNDDERNIIVENVQKDIYGCNN